MGLQLSRNGGQLAYHYVGQNRSVENDSNSWATAGMLAVILIKIFISTCNY